MSEEIQGWFDYANIYNRMAEEVRNDGIIVELGVWKGRSIIHLAKRIKELGKATRIYGVDSYVFNDWDGYHRIMIADSINGEKRSVEQQCRDNLKAAGVDDVVTLLKMDAIEAASEFKDGSVDFVWFDDTHRAEHVQKEIAAWLPKVKRPTWLAGHDYPGLIQAGVLHHFPHAQQCGTSWIATIASAQLMAELQTENRDKLLPLFVDDMQATFKDLINKTK
jgi:hypothetical protein